MKKKRVLWSVLFALCFALFGLSARAEEDSYPQSEWTDAKYFTFDASTGTITGYSKDGPKDVIIPAEIHGVAVRHIGEYAFYEWSNELRKNLYEIRSVQFPESLTSIGKSAFYENQLTQVHFPDSLTSIGDWTFCKNQLTQVSLPESLTSIGNYAFRENQLTQVHFPEGLTSIGGEAFASNLLTQVSFPEGLTSIEHGAFASNLLTQVSFPNSLICIERWAFSENHLTQVHFPQGLTSIGDWAFSENQLTQVSFPQGLTSIGEGAFYKNQLTQVQFPDSLTSIEHGAFEGNRLTQAHFPNSLTSIGSQAFQSNQLTQVHFPNSLTSIGDRAFSSNQLTQVHFPEGLISIGSQAFGWNRLTQVHFPDSLQKIKERAFQMNQLTEVEVPEACNVGSNAFDKEVKIHRRKGGTEPGTDSRFFTFDASTGTITNYSPDGPKDVVIPEKINGVPVRRIGENAFYQHQITSVKLPSNLDFIGAWAFADNSLTRLEMPDSVSQIEQEAFNKNQLSTVKLSNSLKKIPRGAFSFNQLTELTIPNNVTYIGIEAFQYNQLSKVTFPEGLSVIANAAFWENRLTEVTFPNSTAKICVAAFRHNSIKKAELPGDCVFDPEAFDEEVEIVFRKTKLRPVTLDTPSGDVGVQWGKELFRESSFTYNNDLALVCAALSDAAETPVGSKIVQAYRDLGFEEDNIFLYSYPGNPKNRSQYEWANNDVLAFSIAHRNFGDEVLLTFCLRGTVTDGDIGKDLNAGWIGTDFFGVRAHNGFYDFYEDAFERGLPDYLKEHPEIEKAKRERKLKILVTGHSLGGAGANLLGASLNRKESDWSDKSNTFVYTFATPNVYSKDKAIFGNDNLEKQGNENIFNILNKKDFVIYMPTFGFFGHLTPENESIDSMRWKFGRRLGFYFDDAPSGKVDLKNEESRNRAINQHHIMKHYIRAINPGALKELGTIDSREVVVAVHCPVDVEVVNKDGTVVARVVNDEIDESVTEIMTVVDGDKKYFWFDDSTDYTLRVIGNDNGKMDMAVVREDLSTNKVTGASIFKNVEIVKDKKMEGTVSKDAAPTEPTIKLYTLDKNDVPMKEIQSDGKEKENLFAEKVIADPNYSWTVTFNGKLDPSAVNAQNFFIQDAAGNILKGIEPTLVDGTKVRFENHTTFEKNKDYYLVVKKDVRGQGNAKLKKTVILKFRVE